MKLSVIAVLTMIAAGPAATLASAQTTAATADARDKAISEQIARKIADDPALKADAVRVRVENGVVTLQGLVANDGDRQRAERYAKVEGVARVVNNLKTREGTKESVKGTAGKVGEKTGAGAKKVGEKTKEGLSKTGEVITDGWITSRVKTKFMAASDISANDINVDTKDGVVTLTGTVPSATAHAKAIQGAKEVEGVKRVVDNLKIVPKP